MTLKDAAEKLDINYSTAKTIVQTYRKENRISKKPKHSIITKKSLKREQFLSRVLTQTKLAKIMSRIVAAELNLKKRKLCRTKSLQGISEARTLAATGQAQDIPVGKSFPRVESAGQMQLLEAEKEGPKPGQVTRAISANMPLSLKKDVFYVHVPCSAKEVLPAPDPQDLEMIEEKEEANLEKPVIENEGREREDENGEMRDLSGLEEREAGVWFDFRTYGEKIVKSAWERYTQM